ncbi:hypothetical protein ABL78_1872 [Leptomonas seymouri]|uniref:Uncharacterized protein n=1 Tax=Leptomonas seymouri TaxID=5684 RepID=A0A0N1I895_LEPSE|nr:hypothetical protein ABL78_1872 [Leptomonas seymouri]|eukprot:KPI88988.1 hypothetical protein ABL78_1872 [Leptomonas seymouri]
MASYNYFSNPTTARAPARCTPAGGSSANIENSCCGCSNGRERVTRILVVGETRVGKTLLIRRLCNHIFGDTSIETNTQDFSPFNSSAATESAADEDDLGPEWGPTVGIAISALKRSTTVLCDKPCVSKPNVADIFPTTQAVGPSAFLPPFSHPISDSSYGAYPSLYSAAPTSGNGGSLQYRGASTAAVGGGNNNFNSYIGSPSLNPRMVNPAPQQHRCTVKQTVEFHELGGTHGYRDIARLPLRNIQYDGVIFVYHRRNLTSTVYLSDWYHWVRSVLSIGAGVSGPGDPHNSSNRFKTMPPFMLVGTHLEGDELTAAVAGVRKEVDSTLHIGTVAVLDEALLDGNFEVKTRVLQSPQTLTRYGRVKRGCCTLVNSLALPYRILWCLLHPFFFLSEQYQEERGPCNKVVAPFIRLLERFLWLLYLLEQALQYLMAVVLFGPYQEAVVLGHSCTKQTLEELRKDEQCVAQAHVCRLDSDVALQSSLDETLAFFDILLRDE